MSAKVLKAAALYIAKVGSKLCNHSIKHDTIPAAMET